MNNPFDLGTPQTQGYKTSNANTSSMSLLTIINDGDKNEIRARLEYATTSGENLDYAVNSIYDFIHSRELALLEGLKMRIEGMKRNYCTSGCGCSLEEHKMGHEGECVWREDEDFNGAIDEILAIAELDEAITHLKEKK